MGLWEARRSLLFIASSWTDRHTYLGPAGWPMLCSFPDPLPF